MAVKTKSVTKVNKVQPLLISIICILAFGIFYYLWTKSCEIIFRSRKQDGQGWGLLNIFSSGDHAAVEAVSFTEKEFYVALLLLIKDDMISVSYSVYSLVPLSIENFVGESNVKIILSTFLLLIITCCIYVTLFRKSKVDEIKKKKRKTEKQDKKSGNEKERDEKEASHHGNKKYYWRWLTGLLFIAFLLSIPWEFVRLYQSMVAEKVTQMTTGIPVECVPEQMSVTQSLKSWLRWQFSWTADPCLQYHKALLIDPMWQVPPLMVISSAFSHCLVYPVEVFFGGLGKAFRLFFSEIPTPWQPVMLIVMVTIIVLILIMMFGYRLQLPFILKFEPKTPVYLRIKARKKPEVESEKRNLNFSIESSQDTDFCGSQDNQYTQDSTLDSQSY